MKIDFKDPKFFAGVGAVIAVALIVKSQMEPSVPTVDEFYQRNPHLTRPQAMIEPEPVVKRSSSKFSDGDFWLEAGKSYPVKFVHELGYSAVDAKPQSSKLSGQVDFRSLGIVDGRLQLVADFRLDKKKGLPEVPAPARSWLVKLDPRGLVREAFATIPRVNDDVAEVNLIVLDSVFKKVAPLTLGKRIVTEGDLNGRPYPLTVNIQDQGESLLIEHSNVSKQQLAGDEKKAAAAGAAGMGLVMLETNQDQAMKWLWSKKEQRPVSQSAEGNTKMIYEGKTLAVMKVRSEFAWGEVKNIEIDSALISKFVYPIDLAALRARIKEKNSKKVGKQNAESFKSWQDLTKELQLVRTGKSTEKMIESLLVNLSEKIKDNPKLIGEAKRLAEEAAPGSREVSILMGALGFDGSPASQKALIDLFNRPYATIDEKHKVMTEFSLATQPLTPETKSFLQNQYLTEKPNRSDVAATAGLAIGTSISLDGDPNSIRFVQKQWEQADTGFSKPKNEEINQQRYLLSVMGNSKSDVFIDEIKSVSNSNEVELRSGAAAAVRFNQDLTGRDLLFDRFLKDSNSEVRLAAVNGLMYQPFDDRTKNALLGCSANDSDIGVKIACYRVLGYRITQPGIRDYLQSREGSESDARVKNTITAALSIQQNQSGQ